MIEKRSSAATVCVAAAAALLAPAYLGADDRRDLPGKDGISHVLLISIDGMHALDYQNCVNANTCPVLKSLGQHGVTYTRASTSKPSDSFPGLMSIVSGASPRLHGAFYDVAYDRVLAPPQNDTGNGVFSGDCKTGHAIGTTTEYEEGVDLNQNFLNGIGQGVLLADGGVNSIDPTRLPRDPLNGCLPVYPWNFIRTNTIFGVIHKHGGYTAWSDKHPVYAAVSGPTSATDNTASNVDDYYSPEINSNVVALPKGTLPGGTGDFKTADGLSCDVGGNPPDTTQTGSWTDSFQNIRCYDQLKVNAILNEIDGKDHLGKSTKKVPNIFGMNFQAVSVGQKLIEGGVVKGGYLDNTGAPTGNLLTEIQFVDKAIGQMVEELQDKGLFDSTLIIITAKHGQSPIDPNRFEEKKKGITTTPANILAANFLPPPPAPENPNTPDKTITVAHGQFKVGDTLSAIGPTQDDISLLWLKPGADVPGAVSALETSGVGGIGLGQIFSGPSILPMFNAPGVPVELDKCCSLSPGDLDPRTPDIIVQPDPGVIYTGSTAKQEEHGGFAQDDTNVMMLVSTPRLTPKTLTAGVETSQVAPTILSALGLDPTELDGVQKEGTLVLPGLSF